MSSPVLLCIDDRAELLQIRTANLSRLGFIVEVATTSPSAIEILNKRSVAAILIEYKFEGMDEEAVALHIKRRFPVIPIILLSAYSDLPEHILWLVDEYLMRSDPLEKVVEIVDRLARRDGTAAVGSSSRFPKRLRA